MATDDQDPPHRTVSDDEPLGWAEADAERFLALVAVERLALARERFAGGDPVVRGPAGARAERTVARLLAADREGALVAVASDSVNPAEDRAEEALQRALRSLTTWAFEAARRDFAEAASLARVAARQQRIALLRAIMALQVALARTVPGERPRGEEAAVLGLLGRLDALSSHERTHYQGEIERLVGHWRDAATSTEAWEVWALWRGRLALRDRADEATLAWAIRAWDHAADRRGDADPRLMTLIAAARAVFRSLADGPGDETSDETPDAPRASDFLAAIGAALSGDDGAEPLAATARFALAPFHASAAGGGDEVSL